MTRANAVAEPSGAASRRSGPGAFWRDARGSGNAIEFAILLPLILLLLLGAYEIWRVIALRESLDRGVLQAAEYWSTCPAPAGPQPYRLTAEWLVRREVENNSLLRASPAAPLDLSLRYYSLQSGAEIYDPAVLGQFDPFVIVARLAVPWEIRLPLMPTQRLVLESRHLSFKEMPFVWPSPTPSPTPI
jgi:hypothetical protein